MACTSVMPGVIACGPSASNMRKRIRRCPTCECQTEHVEIHEYYHGVTAGCCRCGDSWSDEGRNYRPLRHGWRTERVQRYRRLWDVASHGPDPTFEEWR